MADPHVTAPAEALIPPDDKETGRNWLIRLISVLATAAACLLAPTMLGASIGSLFGSGGAWLLGLGGFVAGGYFLAAISKRLFVYNEEWKGYVTNNPFGGKNVAYGPGLHYAHWWEQRNKESEYDLGVITKPIDLKAQTKSANVTVTGSFQYRIDLGRITQFIGINPSTVEIGLIAFIKSFLTEVLGEYDAEQARTKLGEVNTKLKNKFVGDARELEVKYGIETVNLFLETIQLPEEAQKTRDSVDEAVQLMKIVATLSGMKAEEYEVARKAGTITAEQHKQLLDRAMAVSNNNAKVNVNTFEGGGNVTPMVTIPNN